MSRPLIPDLLGLKRTYNSNKPINSNDKKFKDRLDMLMEQSKYNPITGSSGTITTAGTSSAAISKFEIISGISGGYINGNSNSINAQGIILDKNKLKNYSLEDIDNILTMLTIFIDDRDVIVKMEKMYKHWKAIQN